LNLALERRKEAIKQRLEVVVDQDLLALREVDAEYQTDIEASLQVEDRIK
jgi:hypothetical protein